MFIENWRLDQAVTKVEYAGGNPANGALVTLENLDRMAMPVIIEYTTKGGSTARKTLPVEIWQNASSWKVRLDTDTELSSLVIDPDKAFPDCNPSNNTWK
jgi:hypothetical protein